MILEKTFQDFMIRHYSGEKPLLLALSGGPDSLALFYLLKKYGILFGVAHVDHGWRDESGQEADILEKLAHENNITFHKRKLKGVISELVCRQERIKFFTEVYHEHGYYALVLGHQGDDQAETVLKRILEGASLTNLGGMSEVSTLNGMSVWRPLIHIEKREILAWNQKQRLEPFIDSTNEDPKFLRNRMRKEIIPDLAATFGKEIYPSMLHLGEEAKELELFLDIHLAPILQSIENSFLDLSPYDFLTHFEIKYLIRQLCRGQQLTPSREFVATAAELVVKGAANKQVVSGLNHLYIDRKRLFLAKAPLDSLPNDPQPLVDGAAFGPWKVSLKEVWGPQEPPTNWKGAWKGELAVVLPKGDYMLGPSKTPSLSKWWNNHKVPSFLGSSTPAIWKDGILIHEFLTGKVTKYGVTQFIESFPRVFCRLFR